VDPADYRQASLKVWDAMAPGWDERRDWLWETSRAVGESLVSKLAPTPGDTILELAAGAGDTGFAAAALVGDPGRLISTDFSAEMVEVARRRGAELGLSNVAYRVLDAERMDLEADSVDGVLCRWGYMLMADPAAAFRETRRVLRDGGRVAFSVFAPPDRNPFAAIPAQVLVELGHMPPPEPGTPGICALGDSARLEELVTQAGFDPPQIQPVEFSWRFAGYDDYWNFLQRLAGAIAMVLNSLPDDQQATVRARTEEAIAGYRSNGGYEMGAVTLTVVTS
jgi:ubiquinone/menaquinone biosynthesis C-methylase UbiE